VDDATPHPDEAPRLVTRPAEPAPTAETTGGEVEQAAGAAQVQAPAPPPEEGRRIDVIPEEGRRIDVIDGLRGLAILMVIFRHSFFDSLASPGWGAFFVDGVPVFPFTFFSNSWMGVNLFFLDSGFVLYLPFALGKRTIQGPGDVRALYVRRAWRLFPLYYVMLAAGLVLDAAFLHHVRQPWVEIPAYLTFTFPFFPDLWQPRVNGLLWSIGVEFWFSLIFPLLVLLIRRIGMARFVGLAFAVALGTRYLAYAHHLGNQNSRTLNTLADSLPGRIDNFALGMAAATLFVGGWKAIRPPIGVLAALLLFTASCWLWDIFGAFGQHPLAAALGGYVAANLAFFLLLGAALRSEGLLRRLLRLRPLRWMGIGCYSLYLVHGPLLWGLVDGSRAVRLPIFWALTAALSFALYRLVEKPGMLRGKRALR
jgi:peptidoglycan/LPS O-acetylase OafA/YrhL